MHFIKALLVTALATALLGCGAAYNKGMIKADLDDEVRYVKKMCDSDDMTGNKTGLEFAIDAKYEELKSASGKLSVGAYQSLSQELKDYTATAQILRNEQHDRCQVYHQCVYRATLERKGLDACSNQDMAVRETADRIRSLLSGIQSVKPAQ